MQSALYVRTPLIARVIAALVICLGIANSNLPAEEPLPQVERLESSQVLRHLKPNPFAGEPRNAAEKTVAQMYVPEGFKVELIAAEPDLHQPIAFAWDERGRIWVAEAHSYPAKRPEGEGLDKIVIFADEDGDGRFETRRVFAEGLNLVSGLEVGFGGVWVGAAPELLFIPDANGDDRPDGPARVLLDGFGFQDTHETLNSFLWGPDGWLYGIQGVFNTARIGKPGVPPEQRPELRAGVWRYHPLRHEFEIFAHGGSNPWGLDYDEMGQILMTHCRSYWGRGPTTQVMQGGQFWNQVNGNYAPFIVARPPIKFPEFRNYMLASAQYGHGAGGAGPRGSDAIYGGHSHVGTMIYLADNWPEEYRGSLFSHNLGGHQINQQINRRDGSGYETVHAGKDVLFCTDPLYVAVDLQYGPDGAVYSIDWVDPQHCHNPNTERWDRTNGRIYRMQWQAGFQPVQIELGSRSDLELASLLKHRNQWYARTARRLLQERAAARAIDPLLVPELKGLATQSDDIPLALNALWTLGVMGKLDKPTALRLLGHPHEFIRAWTIQLMVDGREGGVMLRDRMVALARQDGSPVVRRYLASAIQRVPASTGWKIGEALAGHGEDAEDRYLPYLLWHGLAPLVEYQTERGLALAQTTQLPQLTAWIYWYAATQGGEALNRVVASLRDLQGPALHKRLAGLWLAMAPRANVPMPAAWKSTAPRLYNSANHEVRHLAERLAASFGDATAFPSLRQTLADADADREARQHAFDVLSRAQDRASVPVFVGLLDDNHFRGKSIPLLARFNAPEIPAALIKRFETFNTADRSAALSVLTSRSPYARAMLDAVASGAMDRNELTAFHIRQLTSLKDSEVDRRVEAAWGKIQKSPAEKLARIDALEKTYREAPLWAYSARAGRDHFEKLCSQCHLINDMGTRVGPDLTGGSKHGVRYYLENIIDPDAVIGTNFQMTNIETRDDEVISGLILNETDSAVTVRTTVGETVVAKADIALRETSAKSMMPEGLLATLPEREQIELLKFVMSN